MVLEEIKMDDLLMVLMDDFLTDVVMHDKKQNVMMEQ